MHGHEIRRAVQVDRTDLWADVKVGSLYAGLKRLAAEGAIEVVRTEQDGNLPPRTIYAVTEEGRNELDALRDAILRDTKMHIDPFDLALQYSGDLPRDELLAVVAERRQAIAAQVAFWERTQAHAAPHLTDLEPMGFVHTLMRLRTELAWHDRLLEELANLIGAENRPSERGDP